MAEKVTKESVKVLLANNDRAVERALLVLVEYQTRDEQQIEHTNEENGEGFAKSDAKMMTSMAMQVKRGRALTEKQLKWLRSGKSERFPSRIGKYAGQLARHANKFPKQKKEG